MRALFGQVVFREACTKLYLLHNVFSPITCQNIQKITKSVTSIFVDEEDIWLSTNNGLLRVDRNEENGEEVVLDANNLRSKRIQSVYQDFEKNVWVATAGGLFRLRKKRLAQIFGRSHQDKSRL